MAEEWEYAQGSGGRNSSRSNKAPLPEVVAYPAPAPSYSRGPVNQAALNAILHEQNRHGVEIDEVDRRNLRAARDARAHDDGLHEAVRRGAQDGIRAPEAARPPPHYDDDRTDSDEHEDHYDAHAGEEYERGRARAAERDWSRDQRRRERRGVKRREKRSRRKDRGDGGRGGGRRRGGTRVRQQVPEEAEYDSDDSTRQIHSREDSLDTESINSDGMSVQSFSTVGSHRSHRSSRSHREPKGILRGGAERRDDRWERGSHRSHRSSRSHRSKAGGSSRGGGSHRTQHDEGAMREDVRREVRARAREQDVERRRGDEEAWDSRTGRASSKSKRKGRDRDRHRGQGGSRTGSSRAKGGRSSSTSTTPGAWGDHKTATLVHFELPCSCRVGLFYVIGLLVMIALLVVGVVMVARALLEAEDGLGQDPAR